MVCLKSNVAAYHVRAGNGVTVPVFATVKDIAARTIGVKTFKLRKGKQVIAT